MRQGAARQDRELTIRPPCSTIRTVAALCDGPSAMRAIFTSCWIIPATPAISASRRSSGLAGASTFALPHHQPGCPIFNCADGTRAISTSLTLHTFHALIFELQASPWCICVDEIAGVSAAFQLTFENVIMRNSRLRCSHQAHSNRPSGPTPPTNLGTRDTDADIRGTGLDRRDRSIEFDGHERDALSSERHCSQ
jgi:hypothetical protein